MAAFEEKKGALAELGVSVFAATVDSEEKVQEIADSGVSFALGWGVDRELGERIGAWWEERRDHVQPAELVFRRDGRVVQTSYSSGPLARTDPDDVLKLVKFLDRLAERKRQKQQEQG